MFIKEYEGGPNHNFSGLTLTSGSPTSNVEGYLHFCKVHDKSFDFRILKNQDGEIICCAWMTGFMRDAFERFGTYLSFDGCHKKMNTALYPYFGILVKDSNNCILPVLEALGQGEQDIIIIFLFQSLLSMAKGRTASEILVVSSDGVMDQSFVTERLHLPNAKFWADAWHLIQRNLGNKKNIPLHIFQQINSALWVMTRSSTKEKFDIQGVVLTFHCDGILFLLFFFLDALDDSSTISLFFFVKQDLEWLLKELIFTRWSHRCLRVLSS